MLRAQPQEAGTVWGEHDAYLFREGTHTRLYERLGCHLDAKRGGSHFAVWAPNARAVSVIGDWNGWRADADKLKPRLCLVITS